jgi:hypothetical protein
MRRSKQSLFRWIESASPRTFTYEQPLQGLAADQYLVDGCEIFVHNREELYMFDILWHELSRSFDDAAWFK